MTDPERLLDQGDSPEARLLASALDEPPPVDLLQRTLTLVVPPPPLATVTGAAAAGAKAGGLLGAIGIGAALGLVVIGGLELAGRIAAPADVRPAITSTAPPSPLTPPPAPAPLPIVPPTVAPSAVAPASSTPPPLTLAAELALLDEARTALRAGNRATARALLDRYAREIPRGQLGREAALLRADVEADPTIDAGSTNP